MRVIIALTLATLFFILACSSSPTKHRKRYSKHPTRDKGIIEQLVTQTKKHKKHKKQTQKPILPSVDPDQTLLLPTVIHSVDGTLMVLVDLSIEKTSQLKSTRGTLTYPINASNDSLKAKIFYIDHTEVTVEQYKKTHPNYDQAYITGKDGCPFCPAMSVDWINADKHCRSVGKRLPTEAEWELAAGGPSKKPLHWGNKINRPPANLIGEKDGFLSVAPVGSFPLGAGPYGALDMIGNVWEWVDTPHSPLPKNSELKKNKTPRIVKGGGWTSSFDFATINYRNVVDGNMKNPTFGFRCVKSVS